MVLWYNEVNLLLEFMADKGLRKSERERDVTEAPADEGRLLLERVRAGQLESWKLVAMALAGDPAAEFVEGIADIPERIRDFFRKIYEHDREARTTLNHLRIPELGDKALPETTVVLKTLFNHLKTHPKHLQVIRQMQKPVLQLLPASDRKKNRRKIVQWKVAVVEGAKLLTPESNLFLIKDGEIQCLKDQFSDWQQYCQDQDLQLCDKLSYGLLQMQEILQAAPGTPWNEIGIDTENLTCFGKARRRSPYLSVARWGDERGVYFFEFPSKSKVNTVRFRLMVVAVIR